MFRSSRRQPAFDLDLLMPEAPAQSTSRAARAKPEVLDAEFVTIKDTYGRRHGNDNRGANAHRKSAPEVTAAAVGFAFVGWIDRKLSRLSVDAYSALVAALAALVFICAGGLSVVGPENTAAAAPVSPLSISHVSVTPQDAGGMEILLINGIVENNGHNTEAVPAIRADLFSAKGEFVASMLISPPVEAIQPANSHGFAAKLRHPGGKTPQIKLSFVEAGASER
ncbi:DUF3426 domain-containing protein [Agrobacterium tumefaciens]|uniref:DUF3426 domain-containing protein n=1 Tax=Agrobacterium tumefaciens TaxID=358 RepID=UPI00287CDBA0|nr:hypothetical protein [Agrobacterium tumefaciens]MDS7595227.1 hypothetical protein [Agrobacterium tumefaciens]